jgi:hypothetical protein
MDRSVHITNPVLPEVVTNHTLPDVDHHDRVVMRGGGRRS